PGHVLSDLVQAILQGREVETIPLDASKGNRSGTFDLAVTLCRLAALGHTINLTSWEEPSESQAIATNGKPAFTVSLTGANYRNRPHPRTPATSVPADNGNERDPFGSATDSVPKETPERTAPQPTVTADSRVEQPVAPAGSLRAAEQGMLAL